MDQYAKGESFFMKKILGFLSKIVSKIHAPFNHKKMTEQECIEIIESLKDGDVLLTHTSGELSNFFLDYYSHGAIFSKGGLFEAVTKGTKETDPMFFLSRKDDVLVLRPKFHINTDTLHYFLSSNTGKGYDFEFESEDGQFYCFEYVACGINKNAKVKVYPVRTPAGSQYLSKSFQNENFDIVWKRK